MTKIKYIFFDFDGVLAESVNVKTEAFRKMYIDKGVEFSNRVVDFHLANGGVSRFEKFKVFNGEWLGQTINDDKINSLADNFSQIVFDGVVNSPEVKGASEFLLTSKKITKFIITGTPTKEIVPILKARNMEFHFKEVFGSPENKDYWVKYLLNKYNINPQESIFVGDAMSDYKAAVNNQITFVLRDTKEAKDLFDFYDGYRIKDLEQLNEIINKIEKITK